MCIRDSLDPVRFLSGGGAKVRQGGERLPVGRGRLVEQRQRRGRREPRELRPRRSVRAEAVVIVGGVRRRVGAGGNAPAGRVRAQQQVVAEKHVRIRVPDGVLRYQRIVIGQQARRFGGELER